MPTSNDIEDLWGVIRPIRLESPVEEVTPVVESRQALPRRRGPRTAYHVRSLSLSRVTKRALCWGIATRVVDDPGLYSSQAKDLEVLSRGALVRLAVNLGLRLRDLYDVDGVLTSM